MERFGESFFYWSGVVFIGLVFLTFLLTIWMAVKGYLSGASEVVGDGEERAENDAKFSSEYGLSGAKWSASEEDVLEDKNS